jgi:hypothetical protein
MTVKLRDFFAHFDNQPHQLAAVEQLAQQLPPELLQNDAEWVQTFRAAPAAKPGLSVVTFTPKSPYSFQVTPHIRYGELCNNEEARRFLHQGQCNIALELCQFAEKVRAAFGNNSLIITSGHRPSRINAAVGGASNSEHLYKPGCGAIDFYITNTSIWKVQEWCDNNWPYSLGYGAPKGFVHLGIRAGRPKVRWDY